MKYYPSYYRDFRCIADKCPDSCCKSWEITIDNDTFDKYQSLQGEIGDRIRSFICVDDDGDHCFSLIDGRCPFLNEKGLCDIHIAFDENMTGSICREHPRFIEEYDGFTEISLSVSCPEAARLIFSQGACREVYVTPEYNGDDDVLSVLIASRKEILNTNGVLSVLLEKLLLVASRDEEEINFLSIENICHPSFSDIQNFIEVLFSECEILNTDWKKLLINCNKEAVDSEKLSEFLSNNNNVLANLFYYFVYRYYLKSVCDLNVFPRGLFIALSVLSIAVIAYCNSMSVAEVSRLFSKEIEHSTENVDILIDSLSC